MVRSATRLKRHLKVRRKIVGKKTCPRVSVFRSNQHIYVQIIDDEHAWTLLSESDLKMGKKGTKSQLALEVGKSLAQKALKKGIKSVVFDRGGFLFHGRIAKVAEGARQGGLEF